jgi:chromosome segregation ATPase
VSVTALQGDYEAQLKSQQNVIHSLENELDILQQQNQDKAEESVDIQEQIKAVRIEISAQESDIRDLDNDINGKVMHNQGIERENENIKYSITENQELRQR